MCIDGAGEGAFEYTSNITNMTYVLNTTTTDQPTAQANCNLLGGHLVSWRRWVAASTDRCSGHAQRVNTLWMPDSTQPRPLLYWT